MAGNVDEWTRDGYVSYQSGEQTDPSVGATATRVARGGDFYSSATNVRAGLRMHYAPTVSYATLGMRCMRTYP